MALIAEIEKAMQVTMEPVIQHIQAKLQDDIEALVHMFDSEDGVRNFVRQAELMIAIQSMVRAIDVLTGKVTAEGQPLAQSPGVAIDMGALANQVSPVTVGA
jgi:predicted RNA-binding protein with EMAP domain